MTSEECITNVLSAPDLKCPLCGKHLEVWVLDDVPLYRCSICGGLGFKLGKDRIERIMDRGKSSLRSEVTCPGCGSELLRVTIEGLKLDSCPGCDWVFVEEGQELPLEASRDGDNCSHYAAALRALGKRYSYILSKF